ncbi:MAG: DUF2071 domain-containing protein [Deinococcota bacterium]
MKALQFKSAGRLRQLTRPWVMSMQWHDLLFMHWPISANLLRPHIPAGLTINTFHGNAYVAVVPFVMRHVRPRGLPSVPGVSFFPEINLRTYVTAQDQLQKPGVWFFSLDAHNPLAVRIARTLFHLPYFDATMTAQSGSCSEVSDATSNITSDDTTALSPSISSQQNVIKSERAQHHFNTSPHRTQAGTAIYYKSVRHHKGAPAAAFEGQYKPVGEVFTARAGSLEHFLTERYCLYSSDSRGRLYRGDIQHAPWPLQLAEADVVQNSLHEAWQIPLQGPPLLHFARYLDVRAFLPKRIRN